MAVSADQSAAKTTLKALDLIRRETGCYTLLGVSNASFGLPRRDVVNAVYLTEALCHGLSAAIVNPCSAEVMKAYYAHLALSGMDEGCSEYISFAEGLSADNATVAPIAERSGRGECDTLSAAIECGLKSRAVALCEQMLKICEPMDIVNSHIIPALNKVGEGYEIGKIYLPGLLMSAESASAAFEVIKAAMPAQGGAEKCKIVLATVKGDIHDIGKNIVKLILENYGFGVIDLGKSVAKEKIVEAVMRYNAPIVGLSALMTTTVPEMEDTIRELRIHAPECRVMVGGAVLTEEYAVRIGADAYAKDAIEAVKCAERLISKK
jgi:5-methyltetrahydrofolate--homocysteine methyltransferase